MALEDLLTWKYWFGWEDLRWKDRPDWNKGGIISACLFLILSALNIFFHIIPEKVTYWIMFPAEYVVDAVIGLVFGSSAWGWGVSFILTFLIFIVLGALIGWLIGKVKGRK